MAACGAMLWVAGVTAQSDSPSAPIYTAVVDGAIHPVSAEFMIETMDRADRDRAALVVFTLRTPGGLLDSTRDIVTHMLAARTPVAIFVAPSGARAASAGFVLIIAADLAVMAPGTHIGAAHPVAGPGEPMDDTTSMKAAADVAAWVRTLAAARQRNVALAEEAVNVSRAFTEAEALQAAPPLIDLVASDIEDLLKRVDGRTIRRFDGRTVVVQTSGAPLLPVDMTRRQRVLSAIAHPNIAYILLSLGMLGLMIELWSPGAILPGVVGAISLLLAFFALQLLPIDYTGVLLIALGLLLLALEIKVTSYGLLTVGGALSLLFGSLMLVDSPVPELQLDFRIVLPVVGAMSAIAIFLVRLGVAAQRQPAMMGVASMIDLTGEALTAIAAGGRGSVSVRGEIWQAVSGEPIESGSRIRVANVDGLTLVVQKE
jgi:membrane-bound serine protease (ClpP class)